MSTIQGVEQKTVWFIVAPGVNSYHSRPDCQVLRSRIRRRTVLRGKIDDDGAIFVGRNSIPYMLREPCRHCH